MKRCYEICCQVGDVFYGIEPRAAPREVRKYTVLTILICDDGIYLNCDDGSNSLAQFPECIFKRIMFTTPEEAEKANTPHYRCEVMKLPISPAFTD